MPAFFVGLFLGSRSKSGQFGNFNGALPLTDGQVANAVLASVTAGILSSALIWAAFWAAVWLILERDSNLPSLQSMIEQLGSIRPLEFTILGIRLLGVITLGLGVIWGTVALMTSIFLAGRKVGVVVVSTVVGGWIVGGVGSELMLSSEALETFRYVFGWACIVIPLVGIATAFVAGWWMKLISRSTLALAVAIVAAMFVGAHFVFGFTGDPESYLPALWGCCLAPSALAAAPLAVWWNRHC
jgi:hypothetical protein